MAPRSVTTQLHGSGKEKGRRSLSLSYFRGQMHGIANVAVGVKAENMGGKWCFTAKDGSSPNRQKVSALHSRGQCTK